MTEDRYLDPTREAFDAFKALPRDVPINMLNLLRFHVVIGPAEQQWDSSFIARYPNSGAFMEMVTDPEYQKAVVNRQAAVLTSRLIRFGEIDGPATFG